MSHFNRPLTTIRAAFFLMSVSLLTFGAGVAQAAPAPSTYAPTPVVHVVQPANERWD